MSNAQMEKVTIEEIQAYVRNKNNELVTSLLRSRYYTQDGHSYVAYTVLNYIVNQYNGAIAKSETMFSLGVGQFTAASYKKICHVMIPFFEETRGVKFALSPYVNFVWQILSVKPEYQNEIEWPRLPLASFAPKRLLHMKE